MASTPAHAIDSVCPCPQARQTQVHAWLLPLPAWRSRAPALAPCVDEATRARLMRIRLPSRREDRLLAAALHRAVLGRALRLEADLVPLYRGANGEPRLALPGLHTSLAHAEGVAAVALSLAGPVGIDVEREDTASLWPILDLVLAPDEAGFDSDDPPSRRRLLELWVRKEAALKAAGVGLARPMASFRAPEGGYARLRDLQGRPLALQLHRIACAGGAVAALATVPGARVAWRWLLPDDDILD